MGRRGIQRESQRDDGTKAEGEGELELETTIERERAFSIPGEV